MPRGGRRPGAGRKATASVAAPAMPRPEILDLAIRLEAAGITPARVLEELAAIGFSDLRAVVSWAGSGGSPEVGLVDSTALAAAAAAAIAEVSQSKDGALKVKMHPKLPALLALYKHFGLGEIAQPAAAGAPDAAAGIGTADPGNPWAGLLPH